MNSRLKKLLLFSPLILLAFGLFIMLGGWVVMALWNALLPQLFGWSRVTFWQALGLLALCRILFGGFGTQGSGRSRMRRRMRDRLKAMSVEERERFERGLRQGVGPGPHAGPTGD